MCYFLFPSEIIFLRVTRVKVVCFETYNLDPRRISRQDTSNIIFLKKFILLQAVFLLNGKTSLFSLVKAYTLFYISQLLELEHCDGEL